MKKEFKKGVILTIVAGLIISFSGCSKNNKEVAGEVSEGTNVTVYEVKTEDIASTVGYMGEIIGREETSVSAKASGEAVSIFVEEGDYVTAGAVLMQLDSTTYQLAYNQAKAAYNSALAGKKNAEASYKSVTGGSTQQSLNQAEASLNAAKIAYDNALDIYNKQKTLYDMGAISQMEFNSYKTALDNATLNYNTAKTSYELMKNVIAGETEQSAKAGLETADAGVMQAKAALDIAENNLNNCTVTAPISGYVSMKNVSKGQMVSPGIGIFTITDMSVAEVQINVTESAVPLISVGTKAKINVPSIKLENAEGTVAMLNPVKNPATGLYSVRVSIPNKDGKLKDGMIADISLVTESKNKALTIPSDALMQDSEGGYYVYTAVGTNAEKVKVETGVQSDTYTEIVSGIKEGDKVIVSGKEYLSETNKKIKIVTE